jgi:PKD repeat protein/translation elongation factor EF-1beta
MLAVSYLGLQAQRTCGTMAHLLQEQQQDPKSVIRRAEIEAFTQNFVAQQQTMRTQAVYTIPVVFHVVYNTAAENISDARLLEQLDVLNKDYRKLNTDIGSVPAAWTSLAADCEINFCLANLDPNGAPTTGITRTSTSSTSFSLNDAVKYTAQGGHDAWNRNQYLNLWVCDLGSGLLGYAQFPGGAAATDGVVIDYAYTGITGASAPYNKGRTATHEVGHWLNLLHIWGDDGTACNGTDQVSDTPNQAGENYGCPSYPHTDACTASNPGVMFMNYMDYTDDACMYFFTNGQKTRMQATMSGSRSALASSNRCSGSATVNAAFTATPTTGCLPLTVVFTNTSSGSPTTYNWNFGDPGSGASNTSTLQNPSHTYNSAGTYTVRLIASNGTSTDTLIQTGYVTVTGVVTGVALPFTESFESGVFTTNNWTIANTDASTTWEIVTTAGTTPGTKSARVDFFNYAAIGQRDGMITRSLNLAGMVSCTLTFDHAYKRYYTTSRSDSLVIYVSTNSCSNTWTRVFARGENGTQVFATTTGTGGNQFVPSTANQWCAAAGNASCYSINLNAFCGNSDVRVKFEGYNDYGNDLYLDNINIVGTAGQAAPVANFAATTLSVCAGSSVAFTDQSLNTPTSWSWNFGDPGSGASNTSTLQNPSHTYNTAGTYSVTMTATNGTGSNQLIRTNYITVRQRPSATATAAQTHCGLNNGGVTLNATGGTPTYSYLWSNSATTANLSNVGVGTYTVTVTDASGCTGTASANVTAVTPPTATIGNVIQTSCGNANGAATVTATSGTPGYTYLWSNGATTSTISSLAAGTYTVTVTDASNCTLTITNSVPAGCSQSNGSATVAATGGSGNYTYAWSSGATTATATGLAAGTYTVTVTSGPCTTTTTATISNTGAPTASISNTQHTSCGQNNGGATVNATGGTGTYSYHWSTNATTASISNMSPGTYAVTVTDQGNCQAVTSVTINASTAPVASIGNVIATTCGGNNGSASATAINGSQPYTYAWSSGQTTPIANGLGAGSVTVTVTDAAGCTSTASATIASSTGVNSSITQQANVSCAGLTDGSATVTAQGGAGNYSYSWSSGANTATATSLGAGTYNVTITDGAGCTSISTVTISAPTAINVASSSTPETASGAGDGSATALPSGGTPPYTYAWSNGQTGATASGLGQGSYTVTVTDGNGCTSTATVQVSLLTGTYHASPISWAIYPNPTNGDFWIDYRLPQTEDLQITVHNAIGQLIWKQEEGFRQEGHVQISLPAIAPGMYHVELSAGELRATKKLLVEH